MITHEHQYGDDGIIVMGDVAVTPVPTADQLAQIAVCTAQTARSVAGIQDPRVAMLSFSTKGSAKHEVVDKVVAALNAVPQIPCTACQYCTKGCPQQINIPGIFKAVNNELVYGNRIGALANYAFATRQGGKADDCIACGQCEAACPQHIHIIEELQKAAQMMEG